MGKFGFFDKNNHNKNRFRLSDHEETNDYIHTLLESYTISVIKSAICSFNFIKIQFKENLFDSL